MSTSHRPSSINECCPLEEMASIRQSLTDAETELKCIETEKETLLELQARAAIRIAEIADATKELNKAISRYRAALTSPRNLDDETLGRVFSLLAKDYGPVYFPLREPLPPQLTLSHVCVRWRRVALSLGCLWNDVNIKSICEPRVRQLHQRWLTRAVNGPVNMIISLQGKVDSVGQQEYVSQVQRILVPFRVRNLHLRVSTRGLEALAKLPPSVLSDLEDLSLTLISATDIKSLRRLPLFASKTRSLEITDPECPFPLDPQIPLPWDQLRCLDVRFTYLPMSTAIKLLQQMPMLRKLSLGMQSDGPNSVELEFPDLKDLYFDIEEDTPVDDILPYFRFPSLTKLKIESSTDWTPETYNTIKEKYSLQNCEEIRISGGYSSTMSAILIDAPRIRELTLPEDVIVDDYALTGVASGRLGRFLTSLRIENAACDIDDVLNMAETRWRNLQRLMGKRYTWKEGFTLLKEIDLTLLRHQKVVFPNRLKVLEEAGVRVLL